MRISLALGAIFTIAACAGEPAPQTGMVLTDDQQVAYRWCVTGNQTAPVPQSTIEERCEDRARDGSTLRLRWNE